MCSHTDTSQELTRRPRQLSRPSITPEGGCDAEHFPHVPEAPRVTKSSLCVVTTEFSYQWHSGASAVKTDPTWEPGSQMSFEGGQREGKYIKRG